MSKNQKSVVATSFRWSIGFRLLQLIFIAVAFVVIPQQNSYALRAVTEVYTPQADLIAPTPAPLPVMNSSSPPELSAQGVLVIDVASGVSLYEKNVDIEFFPASTTKIMTALVALHDYALDQVLTVKTVITEGSGMGLVEGERMTVENLLYGTLIQSANDAAFTLAENHQGGVEKFVERMNELAIEYHLEHTHFTNPTGFDDDNHYMTPRDLGRLSLAALKNPEFAKIVAIPQITVADKDFLHFHSLKNANELLGKVPGIYGIKTGWTENAGQSLVAIVTRNDHNILTVMLKSDDRFDETVTLINWVFANVSWQTFTPPDTEFGKLF